MKKEIQKELKKFVDKQYKKLFTDDSSTAYVSHRAQKLFGIADLEIDQLMSLPAFARMIKNARKSGIKVDQLSQDDLAETDGLVRYLRAQRMYDIIDGNDASSFDVKTMEKTLDVIDGKVK
jgi:hypothetical protein